MYPHHLHLLRSPVSGRTLELSEADVIEGRVRSGMLQDSGSDETWPIIDYIPRFVPHGNYTDNFSLQWNKYGHVLDPKATGMAAYETRWKKETRWPANLEGEIIIEAGCGSGALTGYALATGATVLSFDYSNSVQANYASNNHPNLLLVQADIYSIPFVNADKLFCFGVLQHTPNPQQAFESLVAALKPGGQLVCDIYHKIPLKFGEHTNLLKSKYFMRRWTADMEPVKLEKWVSRYVDLSWPVMRPLMKSSRFGKLLAQLFLYNDWLGLWGDSVGDFDKKFEKDLIKVQMYDMLSPKYDFPATLEEFRSWFDAAGLEQTDVHHGYNGLEGRAVKPV